MATKFDKQEPEKGAKKGLQAINWPVVASLIFMALYALGIVINALRGNFLMTVIWTLLLLLNARMLYNNLKNK